jgi:prefoldin subunit 5
MEKKEQKIQNLQSQIEALEDKITKLQLQKQIYETALKGLQKKS